MILSVKSSDPMGRNSDESKHKDEKRFIRHPVHQESCYVLSAELIQSIFSHLLSILGSEYLSLKRSEVLFQ
jgi:hypothetical protein